MSTSGGCRRIAIRALWFLVLLLVGLVFYGVFLLCWPVSIPPLAPPPNPPIGYEEAARMAVSSGTDEPEHVRPVCRTAAFLHGRRTPRVFLLLHGLSNCPAQFTQLAESLHARGHNVFVPRLPYHGNKDRLTPDYKLLTMEDVAIWSARALEIAGGLGGELVVVGLSVNGTTAAWMAQLRPDIHRCVIIAPFLKPAASPKWLSPFIGKIFLRLPNRFVWWDRHLRENLPGPQHAYPGFPTHVVGEFIALGEWVADRATESPPACRNISLILSEADLAISNEAALRLANKWKQWPEVHLDEIIFPAEYAVPHDMIDPDQPDARIDFVYPRLVEILEKP
jgi:alpha-beta hydrolase superfamily lysophospholipase